MAFAPALNTPYRECNPNIRGVGAYKSDPARARADTARASMSHFMKVDELMGNPEVLAVLDECMRFKHKYVQRIKRDPEGTNEAKGDLFRKVVATILPNPTRLDAVLNDTAVQHSLQELAQYGYKFNDLKSKDICLAQQNKTNVFRLTVETILIANMELVTVQVVPVQPGPLEGLVTMTVATPAQAASDPSQRNTILVSDGQFQSLARFLGAAEPSGPRRSTKRPRE